MQARTSLPGWSWPLSWRPSLQLPALHANAVKQSALNSDSKHSIVAAHLCPVWSRQDAWCCSRPDAKARWCLGVPASSCQGARSCAHKALLPLQADRRQPGGVQLFPLLQHQCTCAARRLQISHCKHTGFAPWACLDRAHAQLRLPAAQRVNVASSPGLLLGAAERCIAAHVLLQLLDVLCGDACDTSEK